MPPEQEEVAVVAKLPPGRLQRLAFRTAHPIVLSRSGEDQRDAVACDLWVSGHERKALVLGLGDQQTVKGIAVEVGQRAVSAHLLE